MYVFKDTKTVTVRTVANATIVDRFLAHFTS
jgi:hypothetical protein